MEDKNKSKLTVIPIHRGKTKTAIANINLNKLFGVNNRGQKLKILL